MEHRQVIDVLVILDRSGSMQDRKADHEGGLKSFVEDQQKVSGEVRFTLIQFDTTNPCEVMYDRVPVEKVKEIRLVPRGGTPLLDAVGMALDHLTKHAPSEVICMVITDGEENSSKEWTRERVKARISDLEKQSWTFLFLGANVDAFAEAGSMGIAAAGTVAFAQNSAGINATYKLSGMKVNSYRGLRASGLSPTGARGQSLGNWTPEERTETMGTGDPFTDSTVTVTTTTGETPPTPPTPPPTKKTGAKK